MTGDGVFAINRSSHGLQTVVQGQPIDHARQAIQEPMGKVFAFSKKRVPKGDLFLNEGRILNEGRWIKAANRLAAACRQAASRLRRR
jgi:hypothetical protein